MRCPNCREGFIPAFSKIMPLLNCDICKGTGELPEGVEYDGDKGYAMRIDRLSMNLTLRQYCLGHDLDAAERSKNERGYFFLKKE